MPKYEASEFGVITRFKVVEALIESYAGHMPRDAARQRLALLNATPEFRASVLNWFDMRWPK